MGTYVSRTVHARTTVRAATGTDKHGERTSGGQGRIERREREGRIGKADAETREYRGREGERLCIARSW